MSPPNVDRSFEFNKLLDSVAEDFLASKGLGYAGTCELVLPVNPGSSKGWTVVAIGGQRFPLSGDHLELMTRMDRWVMGEGKNPATAWFDALKRTTALPEQRGNTPGQRLKR